MAACPIKKVLIIKTSMRVEHKEYVFSLASSFLSMYLYGTFYKYKINLWLIATATNLVNYSQTEYHYLKICNRELK